MKSTATITVKIKTNKTIKTWYKEQAKLAANLYNQCLALQINLICQGERLKTKFDLAQHFRAFELGSDYKDRIYERVATSTEKWLKSELFRYKLYWNSKEKNKNIPQKEKNIFIEKYSFLEETEELIFQQKELWNLVRKLSRKQYLVGRPKYRKKCSLAFSIRSSRQSTIKILRNKLLIIVPKFKGYFSGKYNFLPNSSSYQFKLATLKEDNCGTLWLKLTYEENLNKPNLASNFPDKNIVVGIDMGLKTTRTAVAVNKESKEIVSIYQPERIRYFERSYQALVAASTKDTRHLPFVYRKLTRQRYDNINKDIVKILGMGEEFKFGKPSSAFLFSGRLARSAGDAAHSLFLTRFAKLAELAGKKSGEVNESYTSVTCRKCLEKKSMPLSLRVYECKSCGHIEDRDINSAYQIAFKEILDLKKDLGIDKKKTACFYAVG